MASTNVIRINIITQPKDMVLMLGIKAKS